MDRDRIRRNSGSIQPLLPLPRGAAPTTPQRLPLLYGDPRAGGGGGSMSDNRTPGNYSGEQERWSQRDR